MAPISERRPVGLANKTHKSKVISIPEKVAFLLLQHPILCIILVMFGSYQINFSEVEHLNRL